MLRDRRTLDAHSTPLHTHIHCCEAKAAHETRTTSATLISIDLELTVSTSSSFGICVPASSAILTRLCLPRLSPSLTDCPTLPAPPFIIRRDRAPANLAPFSSGPPPPPPEIQGRAYESPAAALAQLRYNWKWKI